MSEPARQPLVVVFPPKWDPPGGPDYSEFFEGLDVDWMRLASVADATAGTGRTLTADRFIYPSWQANHEVDDAAFTALADLDEEAKRLQTVIGPENDVAARIQVDSFGNVSYFARENALRSRLATASTTRWVGDQLGSVTVTGPRRVILSSESGPFTVTVANGLDVPVSVKLRATTAPAMQIEVPDVIDLPANRSTTLLLEASTDQLGVHNVGLSVTDLEGNPLGSSTIVPIRAAQVSDVIWLIMGGALGLLFIAIVLRLVRRLRGSGRNGQDDGDGNGDGDGGPGASADETVREPASAG
jgi:hypothetical protein